MRGKWVAATVIIGGILLLGFKIRGTLSDSHPWDLNGDGVVDELDQAIFESAYGSTPVDDNWNPACDFDGDGLVSYDDLATLGSHFGETY